MQAPQAGLAVPGLQMPAAAGGLDAAGESQQDANDESNIANAVMASVQPQLAALSATLQQGNLEPDQLIQLTQTVSALQSVIGNFTLSGPCVPVTLNHASFGLFFMVLRIPDSYDAKIAIICNFWTFWPVIQLINHLFKIRQKTFLSNAP